MLIPRDSICVFLLDRFRILPFRSMDAWKAKAKAASASAQQSVQSAYDKKKTGAPSTSKPIESKYTPNRYDPSAAPPISLAERTAQSGVLRGQKEREWVPPPRPPVRHASSSTGSIEETSGGSRPPVPPSRGTKPAFLSQESSKSATGGLKPFSMYNHQDKQEFFKMLDEVSLRLVVGLDWRNEGY